MSFINTCYTKVENAIAIHDLNKDYPSGPSGMPTTYKYYPFVHGQVFKYADATSGWYVAIAKTYRMNNDSILYHR